MHFFRTLFRHLLPTECIVCSHHQSEMLCETCFSFLQQHTLFQYHTCLQCGIELSALKPCHARCQSCQDAPPTFDQTHCLDRYEGVLQHAIHQLKYHKRLAFAHGLAHAWNQFAMPHLTPTEPSLLLPVPLSDLKLVRRGFNQSWEIARRLQLPHTVKPLIHTLRRSHQAYDQVHGDRLSRQLSLRNVFYLDRHTAKQIRNQSVIVFDDVMTTGSTLNEIAQLLKDNGARKISNWVILRTSTPN